MEILRNKIYSGMFFDIPRYSSVLNNEKTFSVTYDWFIKEYLKCNRFSTTIVTFSFYVSYVMLKHLIEYNIIHLK